MREFLCRPGTKYAGVHMIYDSVDEFRKYMPTANLYKWAQDDCILMEAGDWVQAEDGYIVQLFNKYPIHLKGKPDVIITWAFRFPMGTFGVYIRKDGTPKYPLFYAQFTNGDKGSMSGKARSYRSNDYAKVRFVAMLMAGMDTKQAYRLAFNNKKYLTQHQIESTILRLLMDDVVREEIKKSAEYFKDKIKDKIPLEAVIEKLVKHWSNVKEGSTQELNAIKFLMDVHDVIAIDESTGRKKVLNRAMDATEEAQILEEDDAPLLGQGD